MSASQSKHELFEFYFIGIISLLAGLILIFLAFAGPLVFDFIKYKTSQSAILQTKAQDLVNLVFIGPITVIGAILHFKASDKAKYFLSFTAIYIMIYEGFALGVGMEWQNQNYTGNSQNYFWLFLFLVIAGLIMIFSVLSKFTSDDAPEFKIRSIRIFSIIGAIFILIMSEMWILQIIEVLNTGDIAAHAYSDNPNLFWIIRFLDLGFSFPLGLISFYIFNTRPKKAYPFLLLFFGFFVSLIVAVNSMGWMMFVNHDPTFQASQLVVFSVLMIIAILFYLFLILPKIKNKSG